MRGSRFIWDPILGTIIDIFNKNIIVLLKYTHFIFFNPDQWLKSLIYEDIIMIL